MADELGEAPGWDSLEVAFSDAYPGAEPLHYAPGPSVSLGGIVDCISAYETPKGWHLVTFGLTELFAKGSEEAQLSGWGYELTLRTPVADAPQAWALELLLAIARVTQHQGVVFGEGHRLDVGGSIGGDRSPLRAVAFTRDRATQPRLFPFGHYALLQMVGITFPELQKMEASSTEAVLRRLAEQDAELRTDPARGA